MDFPNQPRRKWHLLRLGVFLVALLLLVQSGSVRGEADQASNGRNDWNIESVLEQQSTDDQPGFPWLGRFFGKRGAIGKGSGGCEEQYAIGYGAACWIISSDATALWGLCLIIGRSDLEPHATYGAVLAKDRMLTKGFSLTETGVTIDHHTRWASWIMMATLLPFLVAQTPRVLGLDTEGHFFIAIAAAIAVLDLFAFCAFQLVSPWFQERQIQWAKSRYRRNHALYKVFHLTNEQNWGSLFTPEGEPNEEVLNRLFDHFDPDNDDFLTETELKGLVLGLGIERHNGRVPDTEELQHWMNDFDVSGDAKISREEFLAGVKRWMRLSANSFKKRNSSASSGPTEHGDYDLGARHARLDLATLVPLDEEGEDDDDDDEDANKTPPSRNQIIGQAVGYLIAGSLGAAIIAGPVVNAILGVSEASGISPFVVSFIATPLATSFKAALHFRVSLVSFVATLVATFFKDGVHFHAVTVKKRKKNISMAYSQIYGAVIMKNTMCLGVFLAIVYFRHLVWAFSAEVSVVLFATLIMGSLAAVRTTFPLWMGLFALALYPLSIAMVAYS